MASGPWDNVQLAGPPNGPAWVNSAAQMMGATGNAVSGAFNAYQKGQEFQNQQQLFPYQLAQAQQQQQLSDLFKSGVPTLPNGSPDYASIVKSMIQTGGANTAGQMLPLLSQIQANQTAQGIAGGGNQQPVSTGPATNSSASSPENIHGNFSQPRIPISQPNNFGTGSDEGADTVRSLVAGLAGGKPVSTATINNYAKSLGVSPDADLSEDQAERAQRIISNSLAKQGVSTSTPNRGGTSPVPQSGQSDQSVAAGELNPSGIGGTSAMSPRQTPAQGKTRSAATPPGAIATDGLEDRGNRRTAQVQKEQERAPTAGGYQPPSPVEMKRIYDDAQANLNAAKTFGLRTPEGQAFRDAGNQGMELYKQMRKEREDYAKVTDPKMMEAEVRRKASEKEAEDDASMLKELTDAGITAKGHIGQLDVVGKLGEKVGYGVVPKVQSFLGQHGIETKGLSDIQAYERAIDYMAPQLRPIGSGRLMQQELTAFKASLGGLMTTPEGRKISVENLKLVAEYQRDVGQIASDKRLSVQDRIQKIINFPAPHLKTMEDISGGGQAPVPGARRAPDGKWYVSDPNRSGKYLEVRP